MNRGIATPKKEKKYLTLLESDVGHALHVLGLGKHVQWYDLVDLKASTLTQGFDIPGKGCRMAGNVDYLLRTLFPDAIHGLLRTPRPRRIGNERRLFTGMSHQQSR